MAKLRRVHSLYRGQRLRLTIESLAPGGEGVARQDGIPIFVGRVAKGDTVDVELFDVRKAFARGKVLALIRESDDRAEPACAVFDRCGGCQWQHIKYGAQLDAKRDVLKQALRHIAQIGDIEVKEPLSASAVLHYRNKTQFPVQPAVSNRTGNACRLRAGYFEENSHKLIDLNQCPVQSIEMDDVLQAIKKDLIKRELTAYDENTHQGLVRHICMRRSSYNQDILVTLVVNANGAAALTPELTRSLTTLADELMREVKAVRGVCLNFNPHKGNRILGESTIVLQGKGEIEEVLKSRRQDRPEKLMDGIRFRLSSQSFFQVNPEQAVGLFDEIYDELAAIKRKEGVLKSENGVPWRSQPHQEQLKVIDAYAGVGAIALWISPLAGSIVAVEENPQAVQDGRSTVELNNVGNIQFRQGKAEDVLKQLSEEKVAFDVVILDPPRKGASSEVIESLLKIAPKHIIYVSCNPQTLARDLKLLTDGILLSCEGKEMQIGYKTQRVKPVDLFPQTYHIESVTTLEKV